ncbi:hypothetical protein [Lentzea flava]|uniref:Mycobacterium membrane protein n=1 Tax=Lentzea flava TaxID=103732 RepID=A0ABQ2UB49_9PSEU|nr:hypothetical protein [Lentzea flava]MCP2196379.1 hypothetical protein [Lentzea flava]GGU18275.1 hypothetical protein GCM10010178_07960 [Lentzea flava]
MKTLVVLAVLAVIGTGTVVLVNHFGGWNTLIGKAWAITYEVTTEPAADGPVRIEYLENPDRYKKQTPQTVTKAVPVPFTHEVVINAGEKAGVTASPNGDQVASCRILLDGEKVLASAKAAPGQKVTCETVTTT